MCKAKGCHAGTWENTGLLAWPGWDTVSCCMVKILLFDGQTICHDLRQVSDDQMLPRVKLRKQSAWYNIALIAVVALTCFALGRFSVSLIRS